MTLQLILLVVKLPLVSSTFFVSKTMNVYSKQSIQYKVSNQKGIFLIPPIINDVSMSTSTAVVGTIATTTVENTEAIVSKLLTSFDNIRQYIPLIVSLLVIMDIVLGSPIANGIINQLRSTTTSDTDTEMNTTGNDTELSQRQQQPKSQQINRISKQIERIDSKQIAQDAIQRAQYTMELRNYLNQQRDPMIELQRTIQKQTTELEQNQKQLQNEMMNDISKSSKK
jgi:hypothetical protein